MSNHGRPAIHTIALTTAMTREQGRITGLFCPEDGCCRSVAVDRDGLVADHTDPRGGDCPTSRAQVVDDQEPMDRTDATDAAHAYQNAGNACVPLPIDPHDPLSPWRVYTDSTRTQDVSGAAMAALWRGGSLAQLRNLQGCRVDDLDEGLSEHEAEHAAAQYQRMGYGCVALPEEDDPETFWRVYSDHTRVQDLTDHALALLP
ncbi:hypothetical protein [Streptomyces sp. MNP-20]|uniref:hypothetical protein n=1 Tax=Streptomyces sp. MNP-20 TaxID=2721165 RepID=UPI00155656E7|nr:hypothetical protein [Streptomyces sp. MNP-20]